MSNKAKAPDGYNSKTVQQLQQESQQLLFELGQMHYNEEFSIRQQDRIQEQLEELESHMAYAQRQENNKQVEENNRKVREEAAAKETQPATDTSNAG